MSNYTERNLDNNREDEKQMYLIFSLGEEEFGIDISYVTEIIGILPITPTPDVPEYVQGVINLRGKIIPVMDVRIRFNKEIKEYHDRTCIIVATIKEVTIGLIVDSVVEVLSIDNEKISVPPDFNKDYKRKFVKGITNYDKKIRLLVECEKLLGEKEVNDQ